MSNLIDRTLYVAVWYTVFETAKAVLIVANYI
jgi:hypothetical protein